MNCVSRKRWYGAILDDHGVRYHCCLGETPGRRDSRSGGSGLVDHPPQCVYEQVCREHAQHDPLDLEHGGTEGEHLPPELQAIVGTGRRGRWGWGERREGLENARHGGRDGDVSAGEEKDRILG